VVTLRRINNRLLYVNGKLATECCCECNCCCDTELPAYYQPILRLKISEVQIDSDVPREAVDCIISPEDGWAIPFKEFSGNACVYQNTFRRGEGAATAGVFTITVTIPKSQASCMVIDVRFISCLDCTGSAFLGPPVPARAVPTTAARSSSAKRRNGRIPRITAGLRARPENWKYRRSNPCRSRLPSTKQQSQRSAA
jgi:hypothetical protein